MRWRLKIAGFDEPVEVSLISQNESGFTFRVNDEEVHLTNAQTFPFSIETSSVRLACETWNSKKWRVIFGAETYTIEPLSWENTGSLSQSEIRSEMPGRILKVLVKAGDQIQAGQPLAIMEAMKMENEVRAIAPAIIKAVHIQPGQSCESGSLLIELSPAK